VPAGLSEQRLPAGRYACAEYRGPYGGLSNAWAELKRWVRANDLRAAGGSYELYFNDPMNTAPADLKTGLYLQLV
jgi:AraC family transcriptional regulator